MAAVRADSLHVGWRTSILPAVDVCLLGAGAAAATFAGLRRARRCDRADRRVWLFMVCAVLAEAAGRTASWGQAAAALPRLPAAAPLLHVLASGLAATAIVGMRAKTPDRAAAKRMVLDAATVTVALVLVTSNAAFGAGGLAAVGSRPLAGLLSASDVVLAVLALVTLSAARHPGGTDVRSLVAMCSGLAAIAVGDAGINGVAVGGAVAPGQPFEVLVGGGLLLLAAGAFVTTDVDGDAAMPRREWIAVCAAVGPVVLAALAVAGAQLTEGHLPVSVALGVVGLSALLLARLVVASIDNLALSRTLESQVAERTLELLTREQWFRALVQHSSDVVTVIDSAGVIRYQSPAVEHLLGRDPLDLIGSPFVAMLDHDDASRLTATLSSAITRPGSSFVVELPLEHADGTRRDTETVVTSLLDVPDVRGLVLNTRDVSERKHLQERLAHQAYYDALTGLANRTLFHHELVASLRVSDDGGVAVLFCDLDGFKAVNDSRGHEVGDELLRVVAERLRHCLRPADLVARFGGDEFAVLVRDPAALAAARHVAQRMAESLQSPIVLDGRELRVGVSIGIAAMADGAGTADVLLRNADLAMYRAKADPHQSVVVFEPAMHDALLARLEVEEDLRTALGSGELVLHYQPTVSLATGAMEGVEALMRWYRPGRGMVRPDTFIGIAEDNGFIDAMGQWALFEACRQGAEWQQYATPDRPFSIGVNISARQVTPALVDIVAAALAESGLPPRALLLEMTESVLLGRTEEAIRVLKAIKRLGVRLAIDDFGTGFSSLSYLARFPVDVLKIDKDFIDAVDGEGERTELARTIVGLGRSLRLPAIAEGIERESQCAALREMGCELGQGYLFSRPVPGSGVTELLRGSASIATPRPPSHGAIAVSA